MKRLAAALSLSALAAPALAQDPGRQLTCANMRAVSDKAHERFVAFRGAAQNERGVYAPPPTSHPSAIAR